MRAQFARSTRLSQPQISMHGTRPAASRATSQSPTLYPRRAPRTELSPRGRQMEAMIGGPSPETRPIAVALREMSRKHWATTIDPIMRRTWPTLLDERHPDHKIYKKLRYLGSDLYSSLEYCMLFTTPIKPFVFRLLVGVGNFIPGKIKSLATRVTAYVLRKFSGVDTIIHPCIALSGAIIAVADEAFDSMNAPPKERAAHIKAAARGLEAPRTPAVRLMRALFVEAERLAQQRGPEFLKYYHERALLYGDRYCDMEAAAFSRDPDPDGTAFRAGGTEATMVFFALATDPTMKPDVLQVFFDLATIVQMVDDWVDFEDDRQAFAHGGRPTPVVSGFWTLDKIHTFYADTMARYRKILQAHQIRGRAINDICHGTMRELLSDMLRAMDLGIAN